MAHVRLIGLLLVGGCMLSACQSSESRKEELARICADPVNRAPQNLYYSECLTLYPQTNRQLQQTYRQGAPAGR